MRPGRAVLPSPFHSPYYTSTHMRAQCPLLRKSCLILLSPFCAELLFFHVANGINFFAHFKQIKTAARRVGDGPERELKI